MNVTSFLDFIGGEGPAGFLGSVGTSLARDGGKVVLLDGDMRRPATRAQPFGEIAEYFSGEGIRQHRTADDVEVASLLEPVALAEPSGDGRLAVLRQGEVTSLDFELWSHGLLTFWKKLSAAGWDHVLLRIPPEQALVQVLVETEPFPSKIVMLHGSGELDRKLVDRFVKALTVEPVWARIAVDSGNTDPGEPEGGAEPAWVVESLDAPRLAPEVAEWVKAPRAKKPMTPGAFIPEYNPFEKPPPWNALCTGHDSGDLLPEVTSEFTRRDELLTGLAVSLSLLDKEKFQIIDKAGDGTLTAYQLNELCKILAEESKKFAALSKTHWAQTWQLSVKHFIEWSEILAKKGLLDGPPLEAITSALAKQSPELGGWTREVAFFLYLAQAVGTKEGPAAAIGILGAGVTRLPDAWMLYESKGQFERQEDLFDDAIDSFRRAAAAAPADRIAVRRQLADTLRMGESRESDVEEAEGLYLEILDERGADIEQRLWAQFGLGEIARGRESLEVAEQRYREALETAGTDRQKKQYVLRHLVSLAAERGDGPDVVGKWAGQLLETEPIDLDTLGWVGGICHRVEAHEAAQRCFEAMVTQTPRSLRDRVLTAELGFILDRPDVPGLLKSRPADEEDAKYSVLMAVLRLLYDLRHKLFSAVQDHFDELTALQPLFSQIDNWNYTEMKTIAGGIEDRAHRDWALEIVAAVEQGAERLPELQEGDNRG